MIIERLRGEYSMHSLPLNPALLILPTNPNQIATSPHSPHSTNSNHSPSAPGPHQSTPISQTPRVHPIEGTSLSISTGPLPRDPPRARLNSASRGHPSPGNLNHPISDPRPPTTDHSNSYIIGKACNHSPFQKSKRPPYP